MQIKEIKTSDLIPYARNARTHSDDQVTQVASSIIEFGFTNPVLIDADNGIIAGHGRVMAAQKLGMDKVPTIELAHLTDAQKKAYILADNKMALNAGWDDDLLRLEIEELNELDFDLSLTGFGDDDLAALIIDELSEGLTDDDAVPDAPEIPISVYGDIWILGEHRLMCGDSTSIDDVDKLMDGKKANICFTSPPYNAGKSESLSGNTHSGDNKYNGYSDDKTEDEYIDLLTGFTSACINHVECLMVNIQQLAGNKKVFIEYSHKYINNLIDVAIWDKGHAAPALAKNVMNSRFEYILILTKNKNPSRAVPGANFRGTVSNVFSCPPNRNNEFSKVHAATFPVGFPLMIIDSFTSINSLVLDCFGGTGTTMIACEKTNRSCFMMELDEKYCDVIIKRWQDFTGKQAILESTGEPFEGVENARSA